MGLLGWLVGCVPAGAPCGQTTDCGPGQYCVVDGAADGGSSAECFPHCQSTLHGGAACASGLACVEQNEQCCASGLSCPCATRFVCR